MNDIDYERAALLMDIQSKVANISPLNTAIAGEAAAELKEINEEAKENAVERAEEAKRIEAEEAEQAAIRQREAEDEVKRNENELAKRPYVEPIAPGQPIPPNDRFVTRPKTEADDKTLNRRT